VTDETPQIHLLTTGGTIANPRDTSGYLSGEELLNEIPEVREQADITVTDVAEVGSQKISADIWFRLHEEITQAAESSSPPDGFVVTHGSNSLEETAYFLHLTLQTDIPVTLTAAQRNHRLIGNDGDRNLLDAVKVAASPQARGRGALVVLNDEIHGARDVTKTVSGRPDAWSSGNLGVVGLIDKRDNMRFYRRTERRHAPETEFDVSDSTAADFPQVEVIYSHVDAGKEVTVAAGEHADGIVLASFPTGAPARPTGRESQGEALDELIDELPIVLSHRGFEGWPYPRDPFIWGDTLTPQKARILLALGLMHSDEYDKSYLQSLFETY
jgi:L-asparaginase